MLGVKSVRTRPHRETLPILQLHGRTGFDGVTDGGGHAEAAVALEDVLADCGAVMGCEYTTSFNQLSSTHWRQRQRWTHWLLVARSSSCSSSVIRCRVSSE